jgi:peptide chain release factor 1
MSKSVRSPGAPPVCRLPVVEVRPADGGDDAAAFAELLAGAFAAFLRRAGWEASLSGTDRTLAVLASGQGRPVDLSRFAGVHRVQRVPPTESQGRRHTSTATVAVVDPDAPAVVVVDPADVDVDVFKASGPGGQHRNKVSSGVRLTHRPSGLVVTCAADRSQYRNRLRAFDELSRRLSSVAQVSSAQARNEGRVAQIADKSTSKDWTWCEYRGEVVEHATGRRHRFKDASRGRFKD